MRSLVVLALIVGLAGCRQQPEPQTRSAGGEAHEGEGATTPASPTTPQR